MARFHPSVIVYATLILVLIVDVACGGAATAPVTQQEQPTATTAGTQPAVVPTAQPTAVPDAPAAMVTSTTKRLVTSLGNVATQTLVPWEYVITGFDKGYIYENLIYQDRFTGEPIPMLATKWEMSPDGKDWTFWLQKGVPFHFGFGEFTAKDVKHTIAMITQETSFAGDASAYRDTIDNVEIINDYQVIIHQKIPEAFTLPFYLAAMHGSSVMMSKAQWDAEGLEGYQKRIVSTAPFRYVNAVQGEFMLVERVENHWRITPDFEEMQRFYVSEAATRLATLLAGEVHAVTLPRDLSKTATDRGMKVLKSQLPGSQWSWFFGGQYYSNPEKLQDFPWIGQDENARKVRQAMNKAINRQEIIDQVYFGDATPIRVWAFQSTGPAKPGFNPEWDERWDEMYGYDPERAKALLKEAGYPEGFKFKILIAPSASIPEQVQVGEILLLYWQQIGLEPEALQIEAAEATRLRRSREFTGIVFPISANYRDPQITIYFYNMPDPGSVHSYENDLMRDKFNELKQAIFPEDRARIAQEIGDHKYNEFAEIPFMAFPAEVVVNPEVIAEWVYPGNRREYYSHFEFIKAAKTK